MVPLIAVHMFVFYFGILADDTPPVGLAAYAAAAISRGDPIKTGLQGFGYDIRTALLPFLFIFNTDLLLIDVSFGHAIFVFFISLLAMLLFAAATQGYFIAKSRIWESVVLLFIAFMLFRPGFFLDMVEEPYVSASGGAAIELMSEEPDGADIRVLIEGPDFDTGQMRPTTVVIPAVAGDGETALADQGLTVFEEGDRLLLEEPFPGTPLFDQLGTEYDYYADNPVVISAVEVENERIAKEWFFIPALLLLAGVVMIQRPRARQPAF